MKTAVGAVDIDRKAEKRRHKSVLVLLIEGLHIKHRVGVPYHSASRISDPLLLEDIYHSLGILYGSRKGLVDPDRNALSRALLDCGKVLCSVSEVDENGVRILTKLRGAHVFALEVGKFSLEGGKKLLALRGYRGKLNVLALRDLTHEGVGVRAFYTQNSKSYHIVSFL